MFYCIISRYKFYAVIGSLCELFEHCFAHSLTTEQKIITSRFNDIGDRLHRDVPPPNAHYQIFVWNA